MKSYSVQYVLPCEDPEHNIVKIRGRTIITFEVPINHPRCSELGIRELLEVAQDRKLFTELTDINNKKEIAKEKKLAKVREQQA